MRCVSNKKQDSKSLKSKNVLNENWFKTNTMLNYWLIEYRKK